MQNLTIAQTLTMSSLEIAELVKSRHDKVKQSIERLAERLTAPGPVACMVSASETHEISEFILKVTAMLAAASSTMLNGGSK